MSDADVFSHHIIPVIVLHDARDSAPLAEALVTGGLPVAEVTFRTPAAAESIRIMAERRDIIVGAGTVTTTAHVAAAAQAGATFIVSPGLSAEIVHAARDHGLTVLPGAVTPSEIMAAMDLGMDAVKFFPAGQFGGPSTIKSLSAPFPAMKFVPTGGVSTTNLAEYLSLACVPAVGGSWMVPAAMISSGDFSSITTLTKSAVGAVATITGRSA